VDAADGGSVGWEEGPRWIMLRLGGGGGLVEVHGGGWIGFAEGWKTVAARGREV